MPGSSIHGVKRRGVNFDEGLARAGLLDVALLHNELALGLVEAESFLSRHVGCGDGSRRDDRTDCAGIHEACMIYIC